MNIKHCDLLSWVHERNGRLKYKNHAQDCETLTRASASGDPAMVFIFRMASILSGRTGTLPVMPSGRIAAGRLLSMIWFGKPVSHLFRNLALAHDRLRKSESAFLRGKSCENARKLRA
jgi:hypothetical protein